MPKPLRTWFADLRKIHDRVQNLNHATDADLKAFSKQKLGDLLPSDALQQSIRQFVESLTGEASPNDIFADPKEDFRWFLDKVTRGPVLERLIMACYNVAQSTENTDVFRDNKVNEMFTTLDALNRLDAQLKEQIGEASFYPANVGVATGGDVTVSIKNFCARIMAWNRAAIALRASALPSVLSC